MRTLHASIPHLRLHCIPSLRPILGLRGGSLPLVRKPPRGAGGVPSPPNALIASATADRKLQYAVLAMTGLRAQELQMLRPRDVDLDKGWIHVAGREGWIPKTRQGRRIPIHPKLAEMLADVPRTNRPYFFCAAPSPKYPDGGHEINTKHMNRDLQKLAVELKIPTGRKNVGLVVHSLRHSFETQCVDAAVPQFVVDAWMGHAGQSMMGRTYYGHDDAKSLAFMKQVSF